jgi:hypothetical protein
MVRYQNYLENHYPDGFYAEQKRLLMLKFRKSTRQPMLKSLNLRWFIGALLALILVACAEPAREVSFKIVSPTPRPILEITQVPTTDVNDLTPVAEGQPQINTDPVQLPTATPTVVFQPSPTLNLALPSPTFGFRLNTATPSPTSTESVEVSPPNPTEKVTPAKSDTAPTVTMEAPSTENTDPTPEPTSNNPELRQRQQDRNVLVALQLDNNCYLTDNEIPGRIVLQNFGETPFYLYIRGQLLFSINNSPLGPDFPPPAPSLREDFILLEFEDSYTWQIEDLGLFIQGMGPASGIDFSETVFGLPPGNYWVTAGYSNDKDGLTEQIDGTYLIPEAAWRGIAVSREVRFRVVRDLAECQ